MHQNTLGCESRSVFLKLCPALCLFVCECVVTGHRHALVDFAFSRLDPLRSIFAHTVIISVSSCQIYSNMVSFSPCLRFPLLQPFGTQTCQNLIPVGLT